MIDLARLVAMRAHKTQVRKYTNEPYWKHLAEVAGIAASAGKLSEDLTTVLSVAWLHDTVEDTDLTFEYIREMFGQKIELGVKFLTDVELGNRRTRKELACQRLAQAPGWVQTIKLADLISNTASIVQHDPKFAAVYLQEKRDLLQVMRNGDKHLTGLAHCCVLGGELKLERLRRENEAIYG